MRSKDLQAIAAIALCYLAIEAMGVTCPILFFTGISCAGCGMSRAWLALLRGSPAEAFAFHPLFWLPVPAAALLLFRRRVPDRVYHLGIWTVCVLFLTVYLIRMLVVKGPVVVFQPSQGLFARLGRWVLAAVRS